MLYVESRVDSIITTSTHTLHYVWSQKTVYEGMIKISLKLHMFGTLCYVWAYYRGISVVHLILPFKLRQCESHFELHNLGYLKFKMTVNTITMHFTKSISYFKF